MLVTAPVAQHSGERATNCLPSAKRVGQSVAFPLNVYIVFKCLRLALALP